MSSINNVCSAGVNLVHAATTLIAAEGVYKVSRAALKFANKTIHQFTGWSASPYVASVQNKIPAEIVKFIRPYSGLDLKPLAISLVAGLVIGEVGTWFCGKASFADHCGNRSKQFFKLLEKLPSWGETKAT